MQKGLLVELSTKLETAIEKTTGGVTYSDSGDNNLHKIPFQILDPDNIQAIYASTFDFIYKNLLLLQNASEISKQIEANSDFFENDFDLRHGAVQTVLQKNCMMRRFGKKSLQITRKDATTASKKR
ncbi:CNT_collapsed_G0015780.mRNA.1.CDS.1 [Saccharomyces cerevisiae]|nr:CNT_collapsed_G0015780.mRNA.1.CDS.1 [Saccharomyces cerevisiae]